MARISLLFSLALVLAIGSVLAHPPTQKISYPSTLSQLQSFPYNEISKFVEKQAQAAPNKIQFKILFDTCKGYTEYLGSSKFTGSKAEVFKASYAKFNTLTRALGSAQAQIGIGEFGAILSRSYAVMAERYVRLVGRIASISREHKFNANAKISQSERAKIESDLFRLRTAIRVYVKVITMCTKKFPVGQKIDFPVMPGGFIGGFMETAAIHPFRSGSAKHRVEYGAEAHAQGM